MFREIEWETPMFSGRFYGAETSKRILRTRSGAPSQASAVAQTSETWQGRPDSALSDGSTDDRDSQGY
jgi:hypothetical protein